MAKGKCQTWNCFGKAKYYNPKNGFQYCQKHFDKLGGKIIFDSKNKVFTKLLKIPVGGFQ